MFNLLMRIGIDCHNLEGRRTGVGRYLANLLRAWKLEIRNAKFETVEFFLYFKNKVPTDARKLHEYSHDRENIIKPAWNFRVLNGKSNALFKHWLLPRAAVRDKVDAFFCPDYVLPIYLPSRIKTMVTIHDIIYEARPKEYSWPSWADKILLKWASKQSAKKADIIFVPSEFTKNEILKYYRVHPEKIVVTPLAPDPIFRKLELSSHPAVGGVARQFGLDHKKYILFVGSIFNRRFLPQKIKGFIQFVSLREIPRRGTKDRPEFKFLIIGKNHTKPFQDIAALIVKANQELGRAAIIWQEQTSDEELVYLYNGAFATLWLSSYEGFGLPVLESMACGTPVITCRSGSLQEVAGDAALYIDNPKYSQALGVALNHLINSPDYYKNFVVQGLTRTAEFSWQKVSRVTIDKISKYDKIVPSSRARI